MAVGSFKKKTVRDVELAGKTVLLHAELDAPLSPDGKTVTSQYRISSSLPTLKYLLEQDCKIILISKLGRPDGRRVEQMSLAPVGQALSGLLNKAVAFVDDCFGQRVKLAAANLKPKDILLLENVRFYPQEEANDKQFAKQIITDTGAQVFVQDCFALAHRKEAATDAITEFVPSVAGLHLETEVTTILRVMQEPERPLLAIIGGAKIPDKAAVLDHFIEIADGLALGGALANNFIAAEGQAIGKSLFDKQALDLTRQILVKAKAAERKRAFSLLLPTDVVVSTDRSGTKSTRVVDLDGRTWADITAYPKLPKPKTYTVERQEQILDVGPATAAKIAGAIKLARTVIWNGTMGVTETRGIAAAEAPFAHGTRAIVEAMISDSQSHVNRPFTLVGGGDTVGYIEQENLVSEFNHVSTGGGASLELMAGNKLPGVEALLDK